MCALKVGLKSWAAPQKFSDAFKKQVVKEFESGRLNKMQLQAKYGLKGDNAVLSWCRKFGKLDYSTNGRPMKDPQLQRIKELEKKLKDAELKLKVYDKLIEITNRELGIDTIKKNRSRVVQELATEGGINITSVCCQLGYSKQAYYKSKKNSVRIIAHRRVVLEQVLSIRKEMPRLGGRKLYHLLRPALLRQNILIGRDQLFKWLKQSNLLINRKRRYCKTTNSQHWMRRYPNLIKGLVPTGPEQYWVADITYISTTKGFSFLHLLTDAYSKKVMGYELCNDLLATSTLKALQMALSKRLSRPSVG